MRRISKDTLLEEVLLKIHLLEEGILPFEDKDLVLEINLNTLQN